MNNYFSANQWLKLASLIVVPAFALLFSACSESSSSDGDSIGGIVETTQAEWTDTNLQMSDVDKLVDLSVKTEALRLEFIQMLSNGWQGDLFSGPGENSSSEKAIDVMTALMENADEYKTAIDKPPLSPPAIVFPIVWIILYALMGIGAARIYLTPPSAQRRKALTLFFVQLGFNFVWSLLFFNLEAYGLAFVWLAALWAMIVWMTARFYEVDRLAAYLQIPYILWGFFAGYLNYGVWLLNK